MKNFYFEKPTQLMFIDPTTYPEISWCVKNWEIGIGYKNEIINGEDGRIFSIEEVIKYADSLNLKQGIYTYETWVGLSEEIHGGEEPEGLYFGEDGEYHEN